jgi:hypothetical protein
MGARLTGKEPFLTRDALRMAGHHMFFTSARATRELGYRSRPWRVALEDAIRRHKRGGEDALKEQARLAIRRAAMAHWGKKPVTRVEVVWV